MKRGWILALVVYLLAGFFYAGAVNAGVPQMINYQGTLTDKNGTAATDGNYNLEFKIYDVASGGSALWSEKWDSTTSQVSVVKGIFNVMLGFNNPIPISFFADHPTTYLGIKVGTDSEMLPRQRITSVGYALTAGNGVPKGGIIMWSGATEEIPAGWALCDGVERTLPDGSKKTPPDLMDRFIVGAGSSYGVGTIGGEATHTLTISELPPHTHAVQLYGDGDSGAGGTATSHNPSQVARNYTSSSTGSGTAHNNLPPYYAMAYIMKLY